MSTAPNVVSGLIPEVDPRTPVYWDMQDKAALEAIKECRASPEQQKLFMVWFIKATDPGDIVFRMDPGLSAFAAGKRYVGSQFFSIVNSEVKETQQ
jgi:hypothetical protein